jgi:hypothetical protein
MEKILFDEESGDDEEIATIARKFRKFLRHNRNFRSRESKNSMNPSHEVRDNYEDRNDENQKDKLSCGCKCHECGGISHIHVDCGNLINSKGKAFNVTQSDESDKEEKAENVANYVAFGISYDSEHEISESNSLDSERGICNNELKEECDLKNAYNNLFMECIKLKKLNKQHLQKLKEVNLENDQLSNTLTDSHAIHDTLMYENHMFLPK